MENIDLNLVGSCIRSGELAINKSIFGFQSWYFGYVLAFVLVIIVSFAARMSGKKRYYPLWLPALIMLIICTSVKLADVNFHLRTQTDKSPLQS